jgi:methionine synthase I (cobalamin-dependent)
MLDWFRNARTFLERIDKRPVVCDGAMGTMLYAKGIPLNRCYDELNVAMPQLVKEVHLAYVKAGAEVTGDKHLRSQQISPAKIRAGRKGARIEPGRRTPGAGSRRR